MKKNKLPLKKFKLDNAFARRILVVTLIYILFMIVVWGTIARQFPTGIQPPWLFWLIIGLSIAVYLAFVIIVEIANLRQVH